VGVELQKADALSPSYVDLETDIGRVVLPLPGPRDDAAYPSYRVTIATDSPMKMESPLVSVQLKDERNQTDFIQLNERQQPATSSDQNMLEFLMYGVPIFEQVSQLKGETTHNSLIS
jgi:hypothetical protein